jgi:class 3 adenylate cyclase/tetratricopeptide (TPR) repeat protein
MTFDEVLDQVRELLQQRGRVTYRALKRRFDLDDEYLEDIKAELIRAEGVAADEDGEVLVWTGTSPISGSTFQVSGSQPLAPSTQPSNARRQTLDSSRPEGERRQLTVQFIDLVGSTTLSQQLDPEDYHARVVAYQAACGQVIERYDGHIAQYLGDGVLVYFGYPAAHEEDAVRAVRSGLNIVAAVSQLACTPPLHVRIGIHTGPVVVGEIGAGERTERLALGETPNLAARVQGHAEPDSVVISAATYRLVQGLFECHDLGPQALKGLSIPLSLYRVVGESAAQSRFEVAVRTGLTPLIGRELELELLRAHWDHAKAGAGQVVLLSGEPGIGKSRLVQELTEQLGHEGVTRIEFRCSPYHQNSALYPIIDHLQRLLGFQSGDSPEEKLRKLEVGARRAVPLQLEARPLLAALLSLPYPAGRPPITVSPQKQNEKTQAALVAWLVEEAEKAAVYCAWEDLHWADPSTLEVLTLFLDQVPTTKLLVLLTFRPEFIPPWGNRSHLSQMTLSRLGRSQVEAMVEEVTGGKALPAEVVQQIVAKTDGVPLFVEELTKTVLESVASIESVESIGLHDHRSLQAIAIPATLHDSLMARLDRLGMVKEVAQLGATLGREFSYEFLQAVSPLDERTLQHGLKQLVEAELLYQRGLVPQATYLFKHALIQDTAYQSLLKSTRQQYHRQIAQVLAARFPETVETQPELVAQHYTEAGLREQAIPYWQRAGERATQRSAYVEAVAHLTRGLELLKTLADTPERVQQELTLQLALSNALLPVRGIASPEMEKTVTRARELCQQLGETPQLFPVLFRLMVFYLNRGELQTTRELAEQMMRLAQNVQDGLLLSLAYMALGVTLHHLGELSSARTLLEQAIALSDPQKHLHSTVGIYFDPRVLCRSYAAWTLWYLGYPDQGLKRTHEALALAEGLSHPFTLTETLAFAATFHSLRREWQIARERAEAVMTLSTEQGFPYWLAYGTTVRGEVLTEQDQVEEGIAQMQQGMAAFRATGAEMSRTIRLLLLAAAYAKVGQVEEGLSVVAEMLAFVNKTGAWVNETELYRLKGTLTLQQFKVQSSTFKVTDPRSLTPDLQAEAEACFLKAIEIARRQQAKSLELRAVMSLARLWQQQGKRHEARNTLSEIYGWFTEGFDTKDLQEAKALLDSLGSSV